jgi:hypothetical protein
VHRERALTVLAANHRPLPPLWVSKVQPLEASSRLSSCAFMTIYSTVLWKSTKMWSLVQSRICMQQPCLMCGCKPSDPHHLRYVQPRALGRKASHEFAVPLCCVHHRAAHRAGDERAWWKAAGIDPMKFARRLWKQTRVKEGRLPADEIMQTPQSGLALNSQPIGSTGRDIG